MEDFGYVKKINDNQFIVKANLDEYGTGYGVVPKEQDPENAYDIEEVRKYVQERPEMLFEHYNNEPLWLNEDYNALTDELIQLETWFSDIYDMQMKQYERCVRLGIAFTSKYGTAEELDAQAVTNAARINELRALIKQKKLKTN